MSKQISEALKLTPAQQRVFDGLMAAIPASDVLLLRGRAGAGKTTVLEHVHAAQGGILLGARQFMDSLAAQQPFAIEEAFLRMIDRAVAGHDLVLVDDLHLVSKISNCRSPYGLLLDAAITAVLGEALALKKKLVFSVDDRAPWPIERRAYAWKIPEFAAEDYGCICRNLLPAETAQRLDYARVHRFAPALTAQQLRNACHWVSGQAQLDTEGFVEYLRSVYLISNVQIEEVQCVEWSDLKGVDDVIRELEAKIALPFENDALSAELSLKPKRGVLLAGLPGTGKTTIGRALARRLKSKFFLIDGTVMAGSCDFHEKVQEIFESAKRNAPSVVFIDDADVIFEDDEGRDFYRYLLTVLDGLESTRSERVCVMMTAMNAGSLPPALVRSGRIELWLETRLPDRAARIDILSGMLARLPSPLGVVDIGSLAAASKGLTGADLKSVIEDAKLVFAHDRARGVGCRPAVEYFLESIATVRANRRKYGRKQPVKFTETIKLGFGASEA